jgi:hypothetical protein
MGITPFILSMLLSGGSGQQPATGTSGSASQEQRPAATADANTDSFPVSLDKIQKALGQKPRIVVKDADYYSDSGLPTFRIGIEGQKITIYDILGPDYLRGPVPAGAMTHQEFLNMVTPTDVQGYAAFDNKQGAIVALTSLAMQYGLKKALEAFHNASDARAKEAARKEVQDALEALRKARLEAGLPVDR